MGGRRGGGRGEGGPEGGGGGRGGFQPAGLATARDPACIRTTPKHCMGTGLEAREPWSQTLTHSIHSRRVDPNNLRRAAASSRIRF